MKNTEIEQIKEKIRIENLISEYVSLVQRGKNLWGVCPFHTDTNPSMSISIDKQIFKCFVCNVGGDVFKFISEFKKISFPEAVSFLGEKSGIKIKGTKEKKYSEKDQKVLEILSESMNFYSHYLNSQEGKECLDYAKKRGLDSSIQQEFSLGFAPQEGLVKFLKAKKYEMNDIYSASLVNEKGKDFFRNRLIFGIKDENGQIVGFSGRSLLPESQTKYLNSSENNFFKKTNILYNFFNAKRFLDNEKNIFINEGFMDVIAMHKVGLKNSVAIMGTALTEEHANKLKNLKVNLMLDNDKAGIEATLKSIIVLLKNKVNTSVVINNENKDPDEILTTKGKEALIKAVKNKKPDIEFVFDYLSKQNPLNKSENINTFLNEFKKYLSFKNEVTQSFYLNKIAEITKIDKEVIRKKLIIEKVNDKPLEQKEKKVNSNFKVGRNYSYILINSIIKKNDLIDLVEKENIQINFFENLVYSIFNYYKKIRQGKKMFLNKNEAEEIAFKLFEIQQNDEYYKEENEIREIANRVNYEYINFQIEANRVKLQNTNDPKDKIKVLENIKLLEIQKRKLRDKLDGITKK